MRISDWSSDVCSSDLDDGEAVDDAGPASHPRSALDRRAERGQRLGGSNGAIDLAEVQRGVAVSDLYAGGHSRSLALRRHDEALVDDMNRPAQRRALPGLEMLMIAPLPEHWHVVAELGSDLAGPWPSGQDRKSTRLNSSTQCASRMPSS